MLTLERLKQVLHYDPETGIFTWLVKISTNKIGEPAGHNDKDGYLRIQIDGKIYRCHRLAWLYAYGIWPKTGLDHEDTIKTNNRIKNLRETKNDGQKFNTGAHKNNKLGYKGIRQVENGRFQARITGKSGLYSIGTYKTLEEACKAYALEAKKVHGDFMHSSIRNNLNESL